MDVEDANQSMQQPSIPPKPKSRQKSMYQLHEPLPLGALRHPLKLPEPQYMQEAKQANKSVNYATPIRHQTGRSIVFEPKQPSRVPKAPPFVCNAYIRLQNTMPIDQVRASFDGTAQSRRSHSQVPDGIHSTPARHAGPPSILPPTIQDQDVSYIGDFSPPRRKQHNIANYVALANQALHLYSNSPAILQNYS